MKAGVNMYKNKLYLELDVNYNKINSIVLKQYNQNSQWLIIRVAENGKPLILNENDTCIFKMRTPDNRKLYNDAVIVDNTIVADITQNCCSCAGTGEAEINIIDKESGSQIATMNFNVIIKSSVFDNKEIEGTSEFSTLVNRIADADRAIEDASAAAENANNAANNLQNKLDSHHFVLTEDKDTANGIPGLDENIKIPVAELYEATTASKGITQLTDSVASESTTTAATPNSVKTVYDTVTAEANRAVSAENAIQSVIDINKPDWDDANSKKHTHDNKSILDKISQTLFDSWTAAYQHISDAVRHITGDERTLWNTVTDKVDKVAGKDLSANDYTDDDRNKLADIAAGAEVNQNTFSTVAVGSSAITADSKTDTLTFAAGANVTLTPDTANHKITITAKDTAYTDMAGATADTAGSSGLVPAPAAGEQTVYLRGDGTWSAPTITKLGSATVGSGISPIYLSNGTATASSSTVGSAARPVYMNAGKITAGTYSLGAACAKGVTDSSAPGAISTGTNLPTERDIYYGLPTINGSHSYTSSTSIYAPTSAGISGYILQSNGSSAPSWVSPPWLDGTFNVNTIDARENSNSKNSYMLGYRGFFYNKDGILYTLVSYDESSSCVEIGCSTTRINEQGGCGVEINMHEIFPIKDSMIALGNANHRYSDIYCINTTVSASDRNLKKDIVPLADRYIQFFLLLQPVSYLFKDGTSGRTHIGFIAQDVEEAMQKVGLTDLDFAGFCKDIKITYHLDEEGKEIEEPVLDEDGNPVYIYSLRYEEFIAIITHMVQKQQQEINSLKDDIRLIKKQLDKTIYF